MEWPGGGRKDLVSLVQVRSHGKRVASDIWGVRSQCQGLKRNMQKKSDIGVVVQCVEPSGVGSLGGYETRGVGGRCGEVRGRVGSLGRPLGRIWRT